MTSRKDKAEIFPLRLGFRFDRRLILNILQYKIETEQRKRIAETLICLADFIFCFESELTVCPFQQNSPREKEVACN